MHIDFSLNELHNLKSIEVLLRVYTKEVKWEIMCLYDHSLNAIVTAAI